jgi:hypothetical protein
MSCLLSVTAFTCHWFYVSRWLRLEGAQPPAWLSETLGMFYPILIFLLASAFVAAILALRRGPVWAGLVAVALCVWVARSILPIP